MFLSGIALQPPGDQKSVPCGLFPHIYHLAELLLRPVIGRVSVTTPRSRCVAARTIP